MVLKKEKKNKSLPFWTQILIIISIGIVISGFVFWAINKNIEESKEKDLKKNTVTFSYQDGTKIEMKKVSDGKGVFPPNIDYKGVFRGWSSSINEVTEDIEAHPMIMDITEENLFYFNSVYVKEGEEFAIELFLDGQVNLTNAELILSYDSDVMEFITTKDSEFCKIKTSKKDELTLNVSSKTPIERKTLLSCLTFKAKEKDVFATEIEISCKNGKTTEDGKETPATVSTLNNKIYYLQEVD